MGSQPNGRSHKRPGAGAACRAVSSVLCSAMVGLLTSCHMPAPQDGALAAARDGPFDPRADLEARPLYTFSEADVDRYLPTLAAREPNLTRRVVYLGRKNIGQPYEIFLLGEFPFELYDPDPIYCLSRSDCVTFCEHVYALALSRDWWSFLRTLQRIRYRDGVVGMLTRNHFTEADWNRHNAFLFEDLTAKLGAGRAAVPFRQVVRRAAFFAQFGLGQDIPDETLADFYIPKERVPEILAELRDGDFVNIMRGTNQEPYAGHTGLIALAPDGTVDLLHSARPAVREQPLLGYLAGDSRCVGLKILRLRPDAAQLMASALAVPSATQISAASLSAALAASPLMSTGAPPAYARDWGRAMRIQSYKLTYATPVDPALQRQLDAADGRIGDALGVPPAERAFGVLDLTDLRLALIQPDVMFYGASVPKICLVLAYFATHPEVATDLDPAVERELQLVLKRSDNDLAAKYSRLVGLETIQKLLQSEPYRFYDQEHGGGLWCGKHYGLDEPRAGDPLRDLSHAATVRQCLRYFLLLEQGKLVSAAVCAQLKQLFAAPEQEFHNDGFVRGLRGRDVTVLRKNGSWEDWHLDTARVQHGDRLYLLAGMTRHAKGEEYLAQMAAALDEALCGAEPPAPFAHKLVLHSSAADFRDGAFERARLSADGAGVVLSCPGGPIPATYESPAIEPGLKFNEVLVSWNVDTPAEAGFYVEMRVGRRGDNGWSPYLYVGDWGNSVPPSAHVAECPEGQIDVDYFRSNGRFDRVQYRICAGSADGRPAELRVARVAVCASDLTGIPPSVFSPRMPVDAPPPAAWPGRLPVPFRSQALDQGELSSRICSPASVAMVLAYRGVDRPTQAVAAACYDPAHDIYGNWPRCIQGAYSLGVPGYLTRFADWHEVERMIVMGQPLVISIRFAEAGALTGAPYRTTDGHLLVLTGFDTAGNVAVNDPAAQTPERGCATYLRRELEQVWMRATGGLAYVLLPRE